MPFLMPSATYMGDTGVKSNNRPYYRQQQHMHASQPMTDNYTFVTDK